MRSRSERNGDRLRMESSSQSEAVFKELNVADE
jgi:hypothetical protein